MMRGGGENGARLGRGVEGEVREEGEHLRGTYIYTCMRCDF